MSILIEFLAIVFLATVVYIAYRAGYAAGRDSVLESKDEPDNLRSHTKQEE